MNYVKYACSGCGETFETKDEAVQCCGETVVYHVSDCCEAEIGHRIKKDYPLGGSKWSYDYEVACCTECGNEIDDSVIKE